MNIFLLSSGLSRRSLVGLLIHSFCRSELRICQMESTARSHAAQKKNDLRHSWSLSLTEKCEKDDGISKNLSDFSIRKPPWAKWSSQNSPAQGELHSVGAGAPKPQGLSVWDHRYSNIWKMFSTPEEEGQSWEGKHASPALEILQRIQKSLICFRLRSIQARFYISMCLFCSSC